MLLPPSLVQNIKNAETEEKKKMAQNKLFSHAVTYRNRINYNDKNVSVSAYLNSEVTDNQKSLLNPTALEMIAGFIMKDAQGEGAKKRLPARRLNFIDGQISAHCGVLNSPEKIQMIKITNEVASVLAKIHNDKAYEREQNCAKKV